MEDLNLDDYSLPCVFWIQIIAFLLFIVLFCFSLYLSEFQNPATKSSSTSSSIVRNLSCSASGAESSNNEGEIRRIHGREDKSERSASAIEYDHPHPCNYFKFATNAFLKCFGLEQFTHPRPKQ